MSGIAALRTALDAWVAFVNDTLIQRLANEPTSSAQRLWSGAPTPALALLQQQIAAAKDDDAAASADDINRMSAALQQLQHVETRVQSASECLERCRRSLHGEALGRALLATRHLRCVLQAPTGIKHLLHRFEQAGSAAFPAEESQLESLPHAASAGIAVYSSMADASDALLPCVIDVFHICMLAGALAGWNGPDPQAFARCMAIFDAFVRSLVGALQVELQQQQQQQEEDEEEEAQRRPDAIVAPAAPRDVEGEEQRQPGLQEQAQG